VDGGPAPIAPNASAYAPCTSPAAIANLTDGNYAFGGEWVGLGEFDGSGNGEAKCGRPPGSKGAQACCTLWRRLAQPCMTPRLPDLSLDTRPCVLIAVYGVDAVGNQGSPVTASFLVDNTPPSFDSLRQAPAVQAAALRPAAGLAARCEAPSCWQCCA
jgi:hypothetical protein